MSQTPPPVIASPLVLAETIDCERRCVTTELRTAHYLLVMQRHRQAHPETFTTTTRQESDQ